MKTKIFGAFYLPIIVLTIQTATGQHVADSVLSLRDCIQMGILNNLKIKQAQLETDKSLYLYKEAVSVGLPQVSGMVSFENYFNIPTTMVSGEILGQPGTMVPIQLGTQFNVNMGIQAGQMIYNASYFASLRLFKKSCEISNLNLQEGKEDLAYNIAQLYYFIQISNLQIILIDSNLNAFQKIYSYSEQHYKNGLILKADLDRVSVAINNLSIEKENMQLVSDQQMNMLKYLIGTGPYQPLSLSGNLESVDLSTVIKEISFNNHIGMMLFEQKKELAKINIKLEQSGHLPSLSGYAGYSYQAPVEKFNALDNNDNWFKTSYADIRLSVPVFEGNRIRSRINKSKIELKQVEAGRQDLQNELTMKYINAIQKLNINKSLEVNLNNNLKLSGNMIRAIDELYRNGLKSFTDVLNTKSEYNLSYLSWLNALLQIKLSELEILKINGTIGSLFQ